MKLPRLGLGKDIDERERAVVLDAYHSGEDATAVLRHRLDKSIAVRRQLSDRVALLTVIAVASLALSVGAVAWLVDSVSTNRERIAEIKATRAGGIRITCQDGNERHVHALQDFGLLIAKETPSQRPKTPAQTRKQKEALEIFVDAIAPAYNCKKRLANLTSKHPVSEPLPVFGQKSG